jgi:hypothetical protein
MGLLAAILSILGLVALYRWQKSDKDGPNKQQPKTAPPLRQDVPASNINEGGERRMGHVTVLPV